MSETSVEVELANLRGEVRGFREAMESRFSSVERELVREVERAEADHRLIRDEMQKADAAVERDVDGAWKVLRGHEERLDLHEARWNRLLGWAAGVGLLSGGAGALLGSTIFG